MPERPRLAYSTDGEHSTDRRQRSTRGAAGKSGAGKSGSQASASRGGAQGAPPQDGVVRIRRETQGRRGKTVTTISGLPGSEAELDALLKTLKQWCGAGGARRGGTIEIQGDHRDRVQTRLEALGHQVKLAGG